MALKGSLTSVKRSSDTASGVAHGQTGEEAGVLEGAAEPEPGTGRRRPVGDVDPAQLDPSGLRLEEPRDDVEERRLARRRWAR